MEKRILKGNKIVIRAEWQMCNGRYLVSWSNDGNAGLLFHAQICICEDNRLSGPWSRKKKPPLTGKMV